MSAALRPLDRVALAQAMAKGYAVLSPRHKGVSALEAAWRSHCWQARIAAIVVRARVTKARVWVDLTPTRLVFRDVSQARRALDAGLSPLERRSHCVWREGVTVTLLQALVPVYVARLQRLLADETYVELEPFYADYCRRQAVQQGQQEKEAMAVKLYRNAHGYAVQTECETEALFMEQCTRLFSRVVERGTDQGHWESALQGWLPHIVNICCAYRGYKVPEVTQRTLYTAGTLTPVDAEEPAHSIADDAQLLAEALQDLNGQTSHTGGVPHA